MADPLSLAATIISTAAAVDKVQSLLESRTSEWKLRGPVRNLMVEFDTFRSSVDQLVHYFVDEDSRIISEKNVEQIRSLIQVWSMYLGELANTLQKVPQNDGNAFKITVVRRRVVEEIEASIVNLSHQNQALSLLLQTIALDIARDITGPTQISDLVSIPTIAEADGETTAFDTLPLDEDEGTIRYVKSLSSKQRRYFNQFSFVQKPAFFICTPADVGKESKDIPKVQLYDHSMLDAFGANTIVSPAHNVLKQDKELVLVLCETTSATSTTMPFSRENFVALMENLSVPPETYQALFAGTPKTVYYEAKGDNLPAGLILRTPMSRTENWTLALSWHKRCGGLKGIIYGIKQDEMSRLAACIGDTRSLTAHPSNLAVILCEMLIESDSNLVKLHASDLLRVENSTNFDSLKGRSESREVDFAKMTQSLNRIISRLAFHEMRIHANSVFVDDITAQLEKILPPTGFRHDRFGLMSKTLQERLVHLRTEQRALLLEITCNQKIAQSQLEIVYNLVAQRDNKDNLAMATTQTDIANTTKEDSFAMRTIAVMSIFFLPGTFVSSFFSMDMFDWQAPEGASVLSSRFWIYWAVTIPLTLTVFSIWFAWQQSHHKHESRRPRANDPPKASPAADPLEGLGAPTRRAWFRSMCAQSIHMDEEKRPVEVAELRRSSIASNALSALRSRVPTTQIERSNTIHQGIAR